MPGAGMDREAGVMAWCTLAVGVFVTALNTGVSAAAAAAPDCVVPSKLGGAMVLDDSG